jgi:hypothetical protein
VRVHPFAEGSHAQHKKAKLEIQILNKLEDPRALSVLQPQLGMNGNQGSHMAVAQQQEALALVVQILIPAALSHWWPSRS